ncbi:hypothetical protein [Polyangium sorediatum]|uniref:Lipoprotein n=1 Tax=Polyangium sorediatum TaxID=889274 RepID=A0ABT6NSZ5_9BACT|nr:hypothetical protein [Polyangium sorediatum]MDI1431451.1 hypothetical protein [Polyangium sorediatum]
MALGSISARVGSRAAALLACFLAACTPPPSPPSVTTAPPVPAAPRTAAAPSASASAVATAAPSPSPPPPPEAPMPSAWTTELPAGFTDIDMDGETACGAFRVANLHVAGLGSLGFVRIHGPNGKVVYEAHGRTDRVGPDTFKQTLGADYCGDLTGDGVPEVVMTESSMGAHCCYTHYVISLVSPPRRILMWEKGDAATAFVPVKYRPGPEWQLQGYSVFWPSFDPDAGDPALSYPAAPIVPTVLSLVNGAYARTSLSFPEAYRRDRDETRTRCNNPSEEMPQDLCDIFTWVDAVALGDWDAERDKVKDPELRKALDRRAAETRKKLLKELGSLESPR